MNFKELNRTIGFSFLLSTLSFSLVYAENNCDTPYTRNIVHFADEHNPDNHLITLDSKKMKLLKIEEVEGSLNHHSDTMGEIRTAKYMMMVPKGSNFVTVREIKNGKFVKKIELPFRPRSADAYNKTYNLVLLNSRDRPAGVLIDATSLEIVGKAGFNTTCDKPNITTPYKGLYEDKDIANLTCSTSDFGGDQISGHPIWLNAKTFVLLDRSNRLLHVYGIRKSGKKWETELLQTIKTDTALHQLIPRSTSYSNNIFYGMTESNPSEKRIAGVYKFRWSGKKLIMDTFRELDRDGVQGINGHNLYITPNKRFLYAPVGAMVKNDKTVKGGIFIINASNMKIQKFVTTGFGAGHVNFSKKYSIAMVTNHKEKYVSAINYRRGKFIKNIPLNFKSENIFSLYQSHAPYIEPTGRYFYNFWTDGGVFFRVNLRTLTLDKSVYTGGVPIQGNYYPWINRDCIEPRVWKNRYDEYFRSFGTHHPRNSREHTRESNGYDR